MVLLIANYVVWPEFEELSAQLSGGLATTLWGVDPVFGVYHNGATLPCYFFGMQYPQTGGTMTAWKMGNPELWKRS